MELRDAFSIPLVSLILLSVLIFGVLLTIIILIVKSAKRKREREKEMTHTFTYKDKTYALKDALVLAIFETIIDQIHYRVYFVRFPDNTCFKIDLDILNREDKRVGYSPNGKHEFTDYSREEMIKNLKNMLDLEIISYEEWRDALKMLE